MPITVDYSRPFRSHPRRVELIEAVLAADDVDEAGWIEWKTDVDLTATEGQFKLARAILSFANRSTASAARYADGTAYVILGASHGNQLPGITPMDAADLQQRLQPYLGSPSDMTDWDVNYEPIRGATVLVVTIEPPLDGHRMAPLQKTFNNNQLGTIFVRHGARTQQADPADLTMLQERLLRRQTPAPNPLDLIVIATLGETMVNVDRIADTPEHWLRARRTRLEAKPSQNYNPGLVRQQTSITGSSESVDDYMGRCRRAMTRALCGEIARKGLNQLEFTVENQTEETVPAAELRVQLPTQSTAFDAEISEACMPERRSTFEVMSTQNYKVAQRNAPPGTAYIDKGEHLITFVLGDIRPRRSVICERITLMVNSKLELPERALTWSVTSTARTGVIEGSKDIPPPGEMFTVRQLVGQP